VRPICMSYITHDLKKVMNFFPDFLSEFSKVK
jgi:preprotein translocase subunit SecE